MKRRRILVTVLAFAMLAIAIRRLFAGRADTKVVAKEERESERHGAHLPAGCIRPTAFDAKSLRAPRQAANQADARDACKALCGAC
ncbi:hypothetical protein [Halotalea alkalilenta]|uniref:Uncharacterized protein n=1 Tax=Halotalea alkalilenta TaxID=376489 RepID=A0A172YBA7_9GAMM|nr:hypothetical protein [Halotalea alkalilenta]ANF56530.1 hypothetical protein A5892_02800 [Halotalea alkalilenta]